MDFMAGDILPSGMGVVVTGMTARQKVLSTGVLQDPGAVVPQVLRGSSTNVSSRSRLMSR